MLIRKKPVASIKIDKEDHIKIEHYSDGKKKPCIYCGTLTKKRILGLPECDECVEYGYEKCSECEYGFRASTFHCNGNDLEDHYTFYTACAMRDYYFKLRDKPDFDSKPSAWPVSPIERKKCFKEKHIIRKGA